MPAIDYGAGEYRAGACNIGPREIARRRLAGYLGLAATVVLGGALLATGAAAPLRLVVVAPLYGALIGFYQARRRFCVAFAFQGKSNFGVAADARSVADTEARRADRRAALRMIAICGGISVVAAGLFALLPL